MAVSDVAWGDLQLCCHRTHRPVLQLPPSHHHLRIYGPIFSSGLDQLTNPFCDALSFSWITDSEPTFIYASAAANTRWWWKDLSPKVVRKPGLCQVCDVEALVGCETSPLALGLVLDTQGGTSSIVREITEMRSECKCIEYFVGKNDVSELVFSAEDTVIAFCSCTFDGFMEQACAMWNESSPSNDKKPPLINSNWDLYIYRNGIFWYVFICCLSRFYVSLSSIETKLFLNTSFLLLKSFERAPSEIIVFWR